MINERDRRIWWPIMAITASFLRRTIGHGIDGGGAGSAAAIPPSIPPAIRVETVWDRGSQGGAMVEAVATRGELLAAWIGIAA